MVVCFTVSAWAQQPTPGRVYVFLWFDTEDYILAQSDDSAKRIAAFLTRQGIHATFKMVGEKGRILERRGRHDVIDALAQHEIGYHSNTHSQHPTVAEYESALDWENGVEEFTRRERGGFDDLKRIFGQAPSCYGQPGESWAPQPYGALKKWGVQVYLDEAKHIGLNGKPFWYGGLLNILNTSEGPQLRPNDDWSNLADAQAKFQTFYLRMTSRPEGGIISLYFHPAEFVHREFWDAVNFAHGANPPPQEWKLPPVKTPEASDKAFNYLEELVTSMKSFPRVEFVTASQGLSLFADSAQKRAFSRTELADLAAHVDQDISFQLRDDYTLAPSEVFALLERFLAGVIHKKTSEATVLDGTPYGPASAAAPLRDTLEVPWSQFARTVLDVADFLEKRNQIPVVVWLGSMAVPPEAYLLGMARATKSLMAQGELPETVTISPGRVVSAPYVAADSPALWNWVIFPEGFHSPHLMELARLQTWTLKPARISPRFTGGPSRGD